MKIFYSTDSVGGLFSLKLQKNPESSRFPDSRWLPHGQNRKAYAEGIFGYRKRGASGENPM